MLYPSKKKKKKKGAYAMPSNEWMWKDNMWKRSYFYTIDNLTINLDTGRRGLLFDCI